MRLCKDLREYLLENVRPLEYVDREEAFVRTHTDSAGPSRIGNCTQRVERRLTEEVGDLDTNYGTNPVQRWETQSNANPET